jgi:hypothetical protein
MWCPSPLREGEQHRRKLRSDKYKPPAGHLLEFYESDSSVQAAMLGRARMLVALRSHNVGLGRRWGSNQLRRFLCSFCGQGRKKEEEEDEEGRFPSSSGYFVDSDAPIKGGQIKRGGGGGGSEEG